MGSDIGTRRLHWAQEDVCEVIHQLSPRHARSRRPIAVAFVVVAVLGLSAFNAGFARADRGGIRDSQDASGILDVRRFTHFHGDGNILRHRVTTWEGWDARRLDRRSYIEIRFSNDRDSVAERFVHIDLRAGALRARLYDYHGSGDSFGVAYLRRVKVRKPARNAVVVYLRRWRDLGVERRTAYSWHVSARYRSDDSHRCTSKACKDGTGVAKHRL